MAGSFGEFNASIANDDIPTIGDNIQLSCVYSYQLSRFRIAWRREDIGTLVSVECSSSVPDCERRNSNPSKFIFTIERQHFNLTIRNLAVDDTDTYQCQFTGLGYFERAAVQLEVFAKTPPRSITIHDDRSLEGYQDNSYVTMTTGQPRDLTCTVRGARPPALIEWRTDVERIQVMDQINVIEGKSYLSSRVATITSSKEDDNEIRR
nr:uncharacterized protein LOC129267207 [Lytechinus pictus]